MRYDSAMINLLPVAKTIRFSERATRRRVALALIYDLADFSRFANHPSAERYVPRFINYVSSAMETVIYGGSPYWIDGDTEYDTLLEPVHEKFLGDGALYLWEASARQPIRSTFVLQLCDRLRLLRKNFQSVVDLAQHDVPVATVPREVRFGLAMGDVSRLSSKGRRQREYVGTCINLASRLQGHCKGIGFVAAATIGMNRISGERADYKWVVAKNVKGFPLETVIVDRDEYDNARRRDRASKFQDW